MRRHYEEAEAALPGGMTDRPRLANPGLAYLLRLIDETVWPPANEAWIKDLH